MTHCVMFIIASLNAFKKSSNGFALEPILPMAVPNITLNITMPSTLVVDEFVCLKFHSCNGSILALANEESNKKRRHL